MEIFWNVTQLKKKIGFLERNKTIKLNPSFFLNTSQNYNMEKSRKLSCVRGDFARSIDNIVGRMFLTDCWAIELLEWVYKRSPRKKNVLNVFSWWQTRNRQQHDMPFVDCIASRHVIIATFFLANSCLAFNCIHRPVWTCCRDNSIAAKHHLPFSFFVQQSRPAYTPGGRKGTIHSADCMDLMDFYLDYQWLYLQR